MGEFSNIYRAKQGGNSARVIDNNSKMSFDALYEKMGKGFAQPVYDFRAKEYKKETGKDLPKDAVSIVFGRGAANGDDFYNMLSQPRYNNMKTLDARIDGELNTFLYGYKDFEQLKSFVKDVKSSTAATDFKRLQRRWNHK